ncbi:hypothetical protein CR513_52858, partial [Mucuna pruriens]
MVMEKRTRRLSCRHREGSMNFSTCRRRNPLIQELVNAMRTCKEKISDQQVDFATMFDHVVVAIEASKDLDTMEIEEFQHSLEAHEMRINKRRSTQEQTL